MPFNTTDFISRKQAGIPISMVTCYDTWSAALIAHSGVDTILVGDSLAMVMHGHSTTLPADTPLMALHTAAVRRGAPEAFIIGDMPFLSTRAGLSSAVENVAAIMRAGANAVKIEGAQGNLALIAHLTESGVPVMGHLGMTPQSVNAFGGFRLQGRDEAAAARLLSDALAIQEAGCFALVIECVPAATAKQVASQLTIPVIGIGAGNGVDGQVLVLQDLLGVLEGHTPRFVRKYLDGADLITDALRRYDQDVKARTFPAAKESYR